MAFVREGYALAPYNELLFRARGNGGNTCRINHDDDMDMRID